MSKRHGVGFLLGLWVLAACGGESGAADGAAGAAGAMDDWVEHRDPVGFRVRHPEGWEVEVADRQGVTVRDPETGGLVAAYPFFLDRPAEPVQVLRELPAPVAALLPGARIERSGGLPGRASDAAASLAYNGAGAPGRAALLVSVDGPSGMLYAIAAPAARFEALRPTLLAILRTLEFVEPSPDAAEGGTGAPRVDYAEFRDPREGAFTVEVPRGWTVDGGLFRLAPVDTRPGVEAVSPDGAVRVTLGDPELPPFALPNEMLDATGFREGSWYSPGYGVNMRVMRYLDGERFARWYAERHVARRCGPLAVTQTRARPDMSDAVNAVYERFATAGVEVRLSMGEAAFTCGEGDEARQGYYLAGTMRTRAAQGGVWSVDRLAGYVAAPDRVPLARAVLTRMVATFRLNPEWEAMQQNVAAGTSRIVSQTNAEISRLIGETYRGRQAVLDDVSRRWSNAMLGQTDVVDPATGERWKVASGRNYYWRRAGSDAVAGTDTADRPDIDFTPLREW